MATLDRFYTMLDRGKILGDEGSVTFTAQMKYDFLAAAHTMEQMESLQKLMESRRKKREALRDKLMNSCYNALKALTDDKEKLKDVKSIDAALRVLNECRTEMIKMASADHEADKMGNEIKDGVSAGR